MSKQKKTQAVDGSSGCSQPALALLRKSLNWLVKYNLEWGDQSGRELQREVQEAVDAADGKQFTCNTCGNDTPSPEIVCEECQQATEYDD